MIKFIKNEGDYFSSNYFDEDFIKKVIDKTGYAAEDVKQLQKNISALKEKYFKFKQTLIEGKLRTRDKINETHQFHTKVLNALGYEGDKTEYKELFHVDEKTVLPIRQTLYRGDSPHLMIMEMQSLIKEGDEEPDGLFEQRYNVEDEETQTPPQKYHRSQWRDIFKVADGLKISPVVINKVVSQLFLLDPHRRPKYILLCAGNVYYLLENEKFRRGSYLEFNIENLFDEASIKKDYYGLFYLLLAKETLAPQSEIVLMEQLDEDSHKSAYEVTQDLKEGVIHAVEVIANESVYYWEQNGKSLDDINADVLKNECLNYVYRLLFLFYAESREDLDILPSNDETYINGYSLEMLRDLEQVPLNTASSQNGYFFHESIHQLFSLLSSGYRENDGDNRSFKIRQLDSPLFNDENLKILSQVKLRNSVWQDVICQLSLSRKQKGKNRGRISYANLGINQLGSVYESLLAFRGFFAESDYIEVHRKRKVKESSQKVVNNDGSYLVPRQRIDDFDPLEVYRDKNGEVKIIPKGTFIYRLSGRDRQKSASYYTPEVLTQCTVKYTLKPILERLDKGEMTASELLELKILEPAMGAAAFHNEVINQLAEAYLQYRQKELGENVAPDQYREQTQKVKAFIALNNVYGVDLNPTAVELGKLSLWLNVIHKDMQTPFFGYRLGTGNAVVGAWLKAYNSEDFLFDANDKKAKKDWWNKAPKHLKFKKSPSKTKEEKRLISLGYQETKASIRRDENEIYHFLLSDKGMVPSANIKLLKEEFPENTKYISNWKKEFTKPISADEFKTLKKLSSKIDLLLEQHYEHQQKINALTAGMVALFGAESPELGMSSYEHKESLAKERLHHNAPYFKLKMVFDYWCALWFWDMRKATELPTRAEWLQDIAFILNYELKGMEQSKEGNNLLKRTDTISEQLSQNAERSTLLFDNQRLSMVKQYAEHYRFFHYQLEFIEVFKERGGFDVIVGNPPWVNTEMDEAGIVSEQNPEVNIRKMSAPQVKKLATSILVKNNSLHEIYHEESIWADSTKEFLGGFQNYPLLQGHRNNLYKSVLSNTFILASKNGFIGLVHPEEIFTESKAGIIREVLFERLRFHFQFRNELKLFQEVQNQSLFSVCVYSGFRSGVNFISIANLFHPSTINSSIVHTGLESVDGIKIKDKVSGKFVWNIDGHHKRLVSVNESQLEVINNYFSDNDNFKKTNFPAIHSNTVIEVIDKLGACPKVDLLGAEMTDCWNEVNAVNDEIIKRKTTYPNLENKEMVYNGAHFFVANPLYKNPIKNCKINTDYDVVDLEVVANEFVQRTNYLPGNKSFFSNEIQIDGKIKDWFTTYRVAFNKMLDPQTERTLKPVIIPPGSSHVNSVFSILFPSNYYMTLFAGICSSIVVDFVFKVTNTSNLTTRSLARIPVDSERTAIADAIVSTTLKLNCLTENYSLLWRELLGTNWNREKSLRNYKDRRYALIDIDILTAMMCGLSLKDLISIYKIQFSIVQQYEDDTWYDTKGNIVFTCSKGLTGVGVDRPVWNTIKDLKTGETYEHTIEKSELYFGKKVTYHAPFDKCDRVEDYKTAWAHFEKVFN